MPIPRNPWTEAEVRKLRELHPNMPNDELAVAMGRSVATVVMKARSLGLLKSTEYLRNMHKKRGGKIKQKLAGRTRTTTSEQPAQENLDAEFAAFKTAQRQVRATPKRTHVCAVCATPDVSASVCRVW